MALGKLVKVLDHGGKRRQMSDDFPSDPKFMLGFQDE
jgi:hypothetical protein